MPRWYSEPAGNPCSGHGRGGAQDEADRSSAGRGRNSHNGVPPDKSDDSRSLFESPRPRTLPRSCLYESVLNELDNGTKVVFRNDKIMAWVRQGQDPTLIVVTIGWHDRSYREVAMRRPKNGKPVHSSCTATVNVERPRSTRLTRRYEIRAYFRYFRAYPLFEKLDRVHTLSRRSPKSSDSKSAASWKRRDARSGCEVQVRERAKT